MLTKYLDLENSKMERQLSDFVLGVFPSYEIYKTTIAALSPELRLELITYWAFYWFEEKIHDFDVVGNFLETLSNFTDMNYIQTNIERALNVNL